MLCRSSLRAQDKKSTRALKRVNSLTFRLCSGSTRARKRSRLSTAIFSMMNISRSSILIQSCWIQRATRQYQSRKWSSLKKPNAGSKPKRNLTLKHQKLFSGHTLVGLWRSSIEQTKSTLKFLAELPWSSKNLSEDLSSAKNSPTKERST